LRLREHLATDIEAEHLAFVTHDRCGPFGHCSRSGAQIKDTFSKPQACACDDALNDRSEPLIDFSE
jgi:hypothetical protein